MLSPRENSLAILNGKQPDCYCDFREGMICIPDPVVAADEVEKDGVPHPDAWGTMMLDLPGGAAAHPHVTEENRVIKDIENWRDYVKFPDFRSMDWSAAIEFEKNMDKENYLSAVRVATGVFERVHFLMGMEDALCSYLEYPEEITELCNAIADWKIDLINYIGETLHPEVIFYQDDWGSKRNLMISPETWREIVKPCYMRIGKAIHDNNMIYIHHSDCYCMPIVEDMVEIGIDIWQGVIPENDIIEVQRRTEGKLGIIGGINVPALDVEGCTKEQIWDEVRRAIDTYCPAGRFFPGFPAGFYACKENGAVALDAIHTYGSEWAKAHPVAE